MLKRLVVTAVCATAATAAVWAATLKFNVERLAPEEFARMHASVSPKDEKWTEIPWQTDLQEARRRAAEEKKPLFMWIMDGHPLGCT